MIATDKFFSGTRYAIFGVHSSGRAHAPVLIAALRKAGKTAIVIEPENTPVKGAEVYPTLSEAGSVNGAVLLPPSPWNAVSSEWMLGALKQCQLCGVTSVWIYPDGSVPQLADIAATTGVDAVVGVCPCLHIAGGGFPHNLHRLIASWQKGKANV